MNDQRPDPDALLTRVQEEEAQQTRGKLKIFFGATAGVGKTYAMLEASHERRAEGIDVVAGWVDTHGRAETAVISIALDAALLNRAESPGGNRTTGPDVTILNQRIDVPSSELWVRSQLAAVPTCEPLERTDPKGPVACSE